MELIKGGVIPNNNLAQPITPLLEGDTLTNGSTFINQSPFKARLYTLGDTDAAYLFFDKSNTLIWKQPVRDSTNYFTVDTGLWDSSELTQQYIYDNIQDAYKYQWWSKIKNGLFKDLFLYETPLGIEDAIKAGKYVGNPVVIPYQVTEGSYQVAEGDYLVAP